MLNAAVVVACVTIFVTIVVIDMFRFAGKSTVIAFLTARVFKVMFFFWNTLIPAIPAGLFTLIIVIVWCYTSVAAVIAGCIAVAAISVAIICITFLSAVITYFITVVAEIMWGSTICAAGITITVTVIAVSMICIATGAANIAVFITGVAVSM